MGLKKISELPTRPIIANYMIEVETNSGLSGKHVFDGAQNLPTNIDGNAWHLRTYNIHNTAITSATVFASYMTATNNGLIEVELGTNITDNPASAQMMCVLTIANSGNSASVLGKVMGALTEYMMINNAGTWSGWILTRCSNGAIPPPIGSGFMQNGNYTTNWATAYPGTTWSNAGMPYFVDSGTNWWYIAKRTA
jgi:hypothetical protein